MMRLNHWLATLAGILAMACGLPSALAQSDPFSAPTSNAIQSAVGPIVRSQSPMGYPPGYAPGGPVVPAGYNGYPGGPMGGDPNYCPPGAASDYGGMPPGMQPWPQVTPFEHRYSEHRNEGGIWSLRNNDAARKYFGGLSAALFQLRKPQPNIFGDRDVGVAQNLTNAPPPGGRRFIPIGMANYTFDEVFAEDFSTSGLRLNWGYWDANDTGIELVGWWASQVTEDFNSFQDFNPANPPAFVPRGYVVPANNGQPGGTILFFDGAHALRYRVVAANGQFTQMGRTIWDWGDSLKLRPTYGGRYTFLREGMFFNGYDFFPGPPYQTVLNNDISTHLAGPEVGLRATVGGDFLRVTLGSKFILYVNHERQNLSGENFIDIFTRTQGPVPPRLPFSDSRYTTHVSPAFEQTIHAEIKIFEWIPWVNRMDFFKNAKLRGGLTYLDIGEITRPSDSVRYNSFPYYPRLKTERSKYSVLAWDVGFNFEY